MPPGITIGYIHGWETGGPIDDVRLYDYAVPLPVILPPNTVITLVVDVPGDTKATDAYWMKKCKIIPFNTLFIIVDMGSVRDFFRPTGDVSYCDMLQTYNKHQWSNDGVTWETPGYMGNSFNGGSAEWWPKTIVKNDERLHLSMWGMDDREYWGVLQFI